MNSFLFGAQCSADYGIIMTEPPIEVLAERDVEIISVAGRSGDLVIDGGRYKNIPIQYKCAILPEEDQTLRDTVMAATALLQSSVLYVRLENTYQPETYRMARISGVISIESIVEQAGYFTVDFDCKPQRFLKSGDTPMRFDAPTTLRNTGFPAQPIIHVYGAGTGDLTVGSATVSILGFSGDITLDCEDMDAYRVADGLLVNCNGLIYAPEFPVLQPGENVVTWTGGIDHVEIIPRWWTL